MRLLSADLTNFRLHADTHVDFTEGVTGLIGQNESGKSALLEAITWALYGGDTTRGTLDGIRWHGAPARKGASVVLRFEIGGIAYRIERGEKFARLRDDESDKILAEGTGSVNEAVPEVLGMGFSEFSASFLVLQKDIDRITSMLPTERVAFVRQIMGMGKIDDGLNACRKRKAELSQELRGLEQGLGERDPLVEAVGMARQDAVTARRRAEEASGVYQDAQKAASDAAAKFEASQAEKNEHDDMARAVDATKKDFEVADDALAKLNERYAKARNAEDEVGRVEPELEPLPGLREELDALKEAEARGSEKATVKQRREELVVEIAEAEEQLEIAKAGVDAFDADEMDRAQAVAKAAGEEYTVLRETRQAESQQEQARHRSARADLDAVEGQIGKISMLGEDGECPTCTQTLGDHYRVVMDALQAQKTSLQGTLEASLEAQGKLDAPSEEEVEAEIARDEAEQEVERLVVLRRKAEAAGEMSDSLTNRVGRLTDDHKKVVARLAELPDVEVDEERFGELGLIIAGLEAKDRALSVQRGLASQIPEIQQEVSEATLRQTDAKVAFYEAKIALAQSAFDDEAHTEAIQQKETSARFASTAQADVAAAHEAGEAIAKYLEVAKVRLAAYDEKAERVDEVRAQHLLHEQTDARLAEFRVAIAATIRPEMEELMSGFIHLLTDGRHEAVELSEDFDVTLHENGVPVEVVSGGTEDVAALAMRLALSQMIAERAGHPLSLLILDEVFGSLDESRRANVLALIRRLGGIFEQVIVISHVAETRDAVDHTIEFQYDTAAGCTKMVA